MEHPNEQLNTNTDTAESASPPVSLYLHIPFCRRKCIYCDFNSYAGMESLTEEYVEAIISEIRLAGMQRTDRCGLVKVHTIYLGGGTPTLLSADQIERVIGACQQSFDVAPDAEITAEANPGTVDARYLVQLRASGVNRLSLGVQSFEDSTLRILGRLHSAEQAKETYWEARRAGFNNVSLDLIYGLPSQDLPQWDHALCQLLELSPEHVSLYGLTVEDGTTLHKLVRSGRLSLPDEDLAADMYLLAEERLAQGGYSHYEISNWARSGPADSLEEAGLPRLACRHNLTYWQYRPYLGFGAGAHSFAHGRRWSNKTRPKDYIDAIRGGSGAVFEVENLDEATRLAEAIILGLRLTPGLDYGAFLARFGIDLRATYGQVIDELAEIGLVESDGRLRLTPRGRLLGNEVFARFLPETSADKAVSASGLIGRSSAAISV